VQYEHIKESAQQEGRYSPGEFAGGPDVPVRYGYST
jgi:hypothetical protein